MSAGTERLGKSNRRPPRTGGHVNRPNQSEDDPKASRRQIEFINSLRERHNRPPLSADEAAALDSSQANADIRAWKAMPLPVPDADACPAGWDEDIWHLVLLFEQYARADKIELRAGRPVIYMEIDGLVRRFGLRDVRLHPESYGCPRRLLGADMAARCWFHYPPHAPDRQQDYTEIGWVEVVEVIMAEFWAHIWDDRAVDYFGQYFSEYGAAMQKHWRSLRMVKQADEIVARGNMQAGSKEG